MKPVINKQKCPAQKEMCQAIQACPDGAMKYIEDDNEPLGGKIIVDEALCSECGLCVEACCGQAIDMM
jgi:NAD-dependent dihydropyrimidine dehydrogenase PreA subunit